VGEAIAGRRDEVFLLSKVLSENSSLRGMVTACEPSLRHLKSTQLDVSGKIRYRSVSNFDVSAMEELSMTFIYRSGISPNLTMHSLRLKPIELETLCAAPGRAGCNRRIDVRSGYKALLHRCQNVIGEDHDGQNRLSH
jgi:diketogulonate reductase-like aldo/keto reductase